MFNEKKLDEALLAVIEEQAAELQLSDIGGREKIASAVMQCGVLETIRELSRPFLDTRDGRRALKMGFRHLSEVLSKASEGMENENEKHSVSN
jgi:hypothetical protein